MWLADFSARPAMKDVVVRLEACVSVDNFDVEETTHNEELFDVVTAELRVEREKREGVVRENAANVAVLVAKIKQQDATIERLQQQQM